MRLKIGNFYNLLETYKSKTKGRYIRRSHPSDLFWSTACYLINKKGMEKILSHCLSKNNNQLTFKLIPLTKNDNSISLKQGIIYPKLGNADWYFYDLANTYILNPPLYIANNRDFRSTFHDNHTSIHIRESNKILERLEWKQIKFGLTLLEMSRILNENNIPHFLACGTLLGVIREGKFIDHDEDIDLGILSNEYNSKVENEILKKFNLYKRYGNINSGYEISFIHPLSKVKIDLFLHYYDPSNNKMWCVSSDNKNKIYKWGYTPFKLILIQFLNNSFYIPEDYEKYLIESYGKDWKIPKNFNYEEGIKGGYKNLIN